MLACDTAQSPQSQRFELLNSSDNLGRFHFLNVLILIVNVYLRIAQSSHLGLWCFPATEGWAAVQRWIQLPWWRALLPDVGVVLQQVWAAVPPISTVIRTVHPWWFFGRLLFESLIDCVLVNWVSSREVKDGWVCSFPWFLLSFLVAFVSLVSRV